MSSSSPSLTNGSFESFARVPRVAATCAVVAPLAAAGVVRADEGRFASLASRSAEGLLLRMLPLLALPLPLTGRVLLAGLLPRLPGLLPARAELGRSGPDAAESEAELGDLSSPFSEFCAGDEER